MRPSRLLLLEVLLLFVGYGHSQEENRCPVEVCMEPYQGDDTTCATLRKIQQCLVDVPPSTADCGSARFRLFLINHRLDINNCSSLQPSLATDVSPSPTHEAPPSPSSSPAACPAISTDPPVTLDDADTVPCPTSRECLLPLSSSTMEHCSALTFSHVRPFKYHHSGILTCSLPGAWYLLRHSNFSVEVEGEARTVGSPLTMLKKALGVLWEWLLRSITNSQACIWWNSSNDLSSHTPLARGGAEAMQVNVTFFPHSCSPRRTYVAKSSLPLPSTFTDGSSSSGGALQLTVDTNGTVASLLATWLNTTIVLRQYAGYLAVTIQLPGLQAFESEGLCRGCPSHTHLDMSQALAMNQQSCVEQNNIAAINCFTKGGVTGFGGLVRNASYTDMCRFDVLKAENLDILSLVNATVRDATALPPVGFVPSPLEPTDPPRVFPFPPFAPGPSGEEEDQTIDPMTVVTTTEQPSTTLKTRSRQTDSTTEATSSMLLLGVSSALSQSCHLIHLLTVLVTTLLAALLR